MKYSYLFALKNYRAALIAAFFFGCIAPGSKFLAKELPPQSMAGLLYFFAGLGLLTIILARRNIRICFSRVQRADYKWFFLATLFGGILGPAFLTYGISRISGSTASLLLNLEAVSTSLIAWFIFKEHFEKKIVYGMILIILGCLTLSFNSKASAGIDTFLGFFLICSACLSWGIDNNVTRNISHLDPVLIASFKGLIAGSSNLLLGYLIGEKLFLNIQILQVGVLGFLGIGVSLVAFIVSLSSIGTARTGAVFSTAPFIGSILSIIFLGESLTIPVSIALLLMAGGVWFHLSENHGHEHNHNELGHNHEHTHEEHHQHEHSKHDPSGNSHTHHHNHSAIMHKHPHFPDIHHQHEH
ncbi:MAG: DMT family transporter [Oligoflexia bacterium]|nr:DMT family transporter [Oligoflexia bacterium]